MYPPAPILERLCEEDIEMEGVIIPKGVSVGFAVVSSMGTVETEKKGERGFEGRNEMVISSQSITAKNY